MHELIEQYRQYAIDPDNESFFRGMSEGRLRLTRCAICRKLRNPPLPLCPHCWSGDATNVDVSGRGRVFLLTWIHRGGPVLGVDPPYPIITVELDVQDSLRVTTLGINCNHETLHVGSRVYTRWVDWDGARMPVVEPEVEVS